MLTDGSAVLGLGDIGPLAALPVMEGKAMLFKQLAGIDAYPVCARTSSSGSVDAQRLPQPDQQRARLPRILPRPPGRQGQGRTPGDEGRGGQSLADVITEDGVTEDHVVPSVFDRRVVPAVAAAVRAAAG